MGNTENWQEKELVCSKCGGTINPGEMIFSMSLNMGSLDNNNSLVTNQSKTTTVICFNCSSFALAEEITLSSEMLPWLKEADDDDEDEDKDWIDDDDDWVKEYRPKIVDGEIQPFEDIDDMLNRVRYVRRSNKDDESMKDPDTANAELGVQCSDDGFCIKLDCGDGVSKATSRFYTWSQIVQLLITANPDIFGDIDEPLHAVFPSALTRLGYHVPGWKELNSKQNTDSKENDQITMNKNDEVEYDPEIDPGELYFKLGLHSSEQLDWEHAIKSFSSFIELEPDNAYAYDKRGIAHGSVGCYDQAISDFDAAISIDSTIAGFYCNRGLSYYKKYIFDEAIADLDKAIELDPDIAVFYNNRGLAHRWREDYVSAIEDFDKAIILDPDLIETHNNRGEVYAILGEYEKALADFDRELEINPNDTDAYASRATVLDEMNHGCKNS